MNSWPWPNSYSFEDLTLTGNSLAGQGTSFVCPELKIAFDVAFGLPYLIGARDFFVSHCHMDHAGGIPYLVSQQNLMSLPQAHFYMPESMVDPLTRILSLWSEMEGHSYNYQFHGVKAGDWIPLKGPYGIRPFETIHRVPSLGYTLFKRTKHLKEFFKGKSRNDILQAKAQGIEIEDTQEIPWISFTGDTQIEFLDRDPWVKKSRLLILEVTYIGQDRGVEKAREWGHIHLHELLERLPELECEKLLLIHLSARHRSMELVEMLKRRLPEEWQSRVDVFPRDASEKDWARPK
ncbi:MAG: MBL fold metallo-hydrolase [Bdellovibrionales bacterium]|nr:MBL fold metallo-hydrolase [Bdellovibrionales bacterium]